MLVGYKMNRIAETKRHKYRIEIRPVDNERCDIVELVNRGIRGRHCNIPNNVVNQQFDSIIRDSKLMDGINYYERNTTKQ